MPTRSESGSVPITMDAPTCLAKATASASAAPSSGLGLCTVGNAPSGIAWEGTSWTFLNPKAFKAAGTASAPVPCKPVYAMVKSDPFATKSGDNRNEANTSR